MGLSVGALLACDNITEGTPPDEGAAQRQTENMGPDGARPSDVPTPEESNTAAGIPRDGQLSYASTQTVSSEAMSVGPHDQGEESGARENSGPPLTH